MGLKLNAATGIIAGFVLLVGAGGAWLLHSAEPEARAAIDRFLARIG